jgi:hypothetical protein
VDYFFTAKGWQGEICNHEPGKCDDVRWFGQNTLPENMVEYARFAISQLGKNNWYLEYGW